MIKLSKIQNLLPQVYILFLLLFNSSLSAEENNILIFKAASTSDVIAEISKEWQKINNKVVRASSASSSALAKQIINGAPANIYISASALWIEELSKKKITDLANKKVCSFDQLITLEKNSDNLYPIKIFNPDGIEVSACGNGARCVAYLISQENKKKKI